jgi:hypothetical protein
MLELRLVQGGAIGFRDSILENSQENSSVEEFFSY